MYQKNIIAGNLGGDPEMRFMPDGRPVCNFSVATNRIWTDNNGQQQKETTWFRISAWGKLAENCNKYLSRGRQVLVEGRLRPDPKTGGPRLFTRQDGSVGASYEIVADIVRFMGTNGHQTTLSDNDYDDGSAQFAPMEEDEIPF